MYTISKEFHFSASHQLTGLYKEHPCARLHGHNYKAIFYFSQTQLDKIGFVIDYRTLDTIKQYIDNELDHQHLNDVFSFNPTSEHIAFFLYQK
ncbi:MAG: 6-pyruvoyl trahydropterin synthase family protein, partial [Chitinophagaceae bacterium]